jgi:hypothetical protein
MEISGNEVNIVEQGWEITIPAKKIMTFRFK